MKTQSIIRIKHILYDILPPLPNTTFHTLVKKSGFLATPLLVRRSDESGGIGFKAEGYSLVEIPENQLVMSAVIESGLKQINAFIAEDELEEEELIGLFKSQATLLNSAPSRTPSKTSTRPSRPSTAPNIPIPENYNNASSLKGIRVDDYIAIISDKLYEGKLVRKSTTSIDIEVDSGDVTTLPVTDIVKIGVYRDKDWITFNSLDLTSTSPFTLRFKHHLIYLIQGEDKIYGYLSDIAGRYLTILDFDTLENKGLLVQKSIPRNKIDKIGINTKTKIPESVLKSRTDWESLESDPESYLSRVDSSQLSKILREASDAYYNDQPVISDQTYDILLLAMENIDSSDKSVKAVRAPVRNKVKEVTLPVYLPSLDKKITQSSIESWKDEFEGPYVVSDKLDGITALYIEIGGKQSLFSGGDGRTGQDLSHLVPFLDIPKGRNIACRGELILPKNKLDSLKENGANPDIVNLRSFVSELSLENKPDPQLLKQIKFITYDLLFPKTKPSVGLKVLDKFGFDTVTHKIVSNIEKNVLKSFLSARTKKGIYEVDGIVVIQNVKATAITSGNPKNAFAFKAAISDSAKEAKVIEVHWDPSGYGYLKPRVQIEPTKMGKDIADFVNGFNARYIYQHKIGPGAIVTIVPSGDAIPDIQEIVIPAKKPQMPTDVEWEWVTKASGDPTDIQVINVQNNDTANIKKISFFLNYLGLEDIREGTVTKLYNAEFTSIQDLIKAEYEDLIEVDGIQSIIANKIVNGLQNALKNIDAVDLMVASQTFGTGLSDKILRLIVETHPQLLDKLYSDNYIRSKLLGMPNMSDKRAATFITGIKEFFIFLKSIQKYVTLVTPKRLKINSNKLKDEVIVFSGFRDEELELAIKSHNGQIGSSVTDDTTILLVKNKKVDSAEVRKAKQLEIPVHNLTQFRKIFKI